MDTKDKTGYRCRCKPGYRGHRCDGNNYSLECLYFSLIQFDLESSSGETMAFSFHIIPNKIDHCPFETSTRTFP